MKTICTTFRWKNGKLSGTIRFPLFTQCTLITKWQTLLAGKGLRRWLPWRRGCDRTISYFVREEKGTGFGLQWMWQMGESVNTEACRLERRANCIYIAHLALRPSLCTDVVSLTLPDSGHGGAVSRRAEQCLRTESSIICTHLHEITYFQKIIRIHFYNKKQQIFFLPVQPLKVISHLSDASTLKSKEGREELNFAWSL